MQCNVIAQPIVTTQISVSLDYSTALLRVADSSAVVQAALHVV